jgi:hypothetical protein
MLYLRPTNKPPPNNAKIININTAYLIFLDEEEEGGTETGEGNVGVTGVSPS